MFYKLISSISVGILLSLFVISIDLNDKNIVFGQFQNIEAFNYFETAKSLFYQGNYSKAISELDKAIEIDPEYKEAYNNKGGLLEKLGNFTGAVSAYDKVIEIDPKDKKANYNRALLLEKLGNFTGAVSAYDKVIEVVLSDLGNYTTNLSPRQKGFDLYKQRESDQLFDLYLAKSNLLTVMGNISESMSIYEKATDLRPFYKFGLYSGNNDAKIIKFIIENLDRINELKELADASTVLLAYDILLEKFPNNTKIWNEKASFSEEQNMLQEAINAYDKLHQIVYPHYNAWQKKAELLREIGQYHDAIEEYKKMIESHSTDYGFGFVTDIYIKLGTTFRESGDYNESVKAYNKAIERAVEDDKIHGDMFITKRQLDSLQNKNDTLSDSHNLNGTYHRFNALTDIGISLLDIGDYADAMKYFNRAFEFENNSSQYGYLNKGDAFFNLGNYTEAILAYDKAIEIDPEYAISYNSKGNALFNLGNYTEAILAYDKATEIAPKYQYAYENKGNALNALGEYERAIATFNKTLEIDLIGPKSVQALNGICLALIELGNYTGAIGYCDEAVKIDPEHKWAYNNKGVALENLGNFTEAIKEFDKVIDLDPNFKLGIENKNITLSKLEGNGTKVNTRE